ncbi:MAG: phosphoenolpyruvate--protein phosphotransferase [Verrucomicrobiota bacterium JB022]|nr:phosphoenolpyruvate--protein phosphotransferase [Verrucomicrobiota bacterium JB022]
MSQPKEERVFQGIAAAPGVAHGPAFLFVRTDVDIPKRLVPRERREEEISRFEQGLLTTRQQITQIRAEIEERLGEEEAAIFDAHQMVLEDRALIEETIREVVETGYNIEFCFHQVASRYIEAFSNIDDEYIRERAADIRDVTRRVIFNLLGKRESDLDLLVEPSVLVADDLHPSDTTHLTRGRVIGIISEQGGRTGHSVIMARSLNVPCVVGMPKITDEVVADDQVLVDGFDGVVIVNPSEQTLYRYGRLRSARADIERRFNEAKNADAKTDDGIKFEIQLNIEGNEPEDLLRGSGALGVGLFRTEALFLGSREFPNEEAQFRAYTRVVELMAPHPVTIRTLDLGGDKNPHNSLYGYQEANPFMGFRAIRFCLETPKVFKEQLRAILRASAYGKVKIMYPMIASCEEVIAANRLLDECKEELRREGQPFDEKIARGAMIETPSAAVITDLLAQHCDFFSIGTNDLVQYLLAVDRVNDRIAHLYEPAHPAVIRALNFIFEAGREHDVPVSVCGELAGDPLYVPLLLGLGASELSMTWSCVPEVKYLIREMTMRDAKRLARRALQSGSAPETVELLREFYSKTVSIKMPKA